MLTPLVVRFDGTKGFTRCVYCGRPNLELGDCESVQHWARGCAEAAGRSGRLRLRVDAAKLGRLVDELEALGIHHTPPTTSALVHRHNGMTEVTTLPIKKTNPAHRTPLQALDFMIRNNGNPGDLPDPGGVVVGIMLDDRGRFDVSVEAGETSSGAIAPTLEQALLAAMVCDEGECVIVGTDGHPTCRECDDEVAAAAASGRSADCTFCVNTRSDQSPPHSWPPLGIPEGS